MLNSCKQLKLKHYTIEPEFYFELLYYATHKQLSARSATNYLNDRVLENLKSCLADDFEQACKPFSGLDFE